MAGRNIKSTTWPYVVTGFDVRLLHDEWAIRPGGLYILMICLSSIWFVYPHVIKSVLFRWVINMSYNPKMRKAVIHYWVGGTCPTIVICLDLKLHWHCRSVSESHNSPSWFISKSNVELWGIKEKTIWIDCVNHILSVFC